MGLDASAYFFYGMLLGDAYSELLNRDRARGMLRCGQCGRQVDSKFCPEDGGKTVEVKPGPGLEALGEDSLPIMEGLELVYLDHADGDTYYIAIKESQKKAGDIRGGKGAEAIPLGKSLTSVVGWGNRIRRLCAAIDIDYIEPEYFVGLWLSY